MNIAVNRLTQMSRLSTIAVTQEGVLLLLKLLTTQ